MPLMSDSLIVTLLVLAAELGIFAFCLHRVRQPPDPLRPKLIPYNIVMVFLVVAIFATVAHIISLVTGQQLMPRRGRGMR
jgi:hypothetical protein